MSDGNKTTAEILKLRQGWWYKEYALIRHLISGTIVFFLGVGADIVISHYYARSIRYRVIFQDAVLTNTVFDYRPLPTNTAHHIALGFTEDGHVTWKELP